jgi:predicted phage terminase large subunit-like protein
MTRIRPQPGPQEQFLLSKADIVIYGGAAGGGKSFGLLLDPLKHIKNSKFGAVIFRKDYTHIHTEGGLLDESRNIYPHANATLRRVPATRWVFKSGAKVTFSILDHDKNLIKWQGSQIPMIGFDELTHFSEKAFFFMLSRNRTTCGIKPYVRATCNPDPDSWLAKFLEWWIDQDTGYPVKERSGVMRWFVRRDEKLHWANTKEELWKTLNLVSDLDRSKPKSVTFIMSTLFDNKILMDVNPEYYANLEALSLVERERLLHGNWKIKPVAGLYFKHTQIGEFLKVIPDDVIKWVRAWDLAATSEDEKGKAAYTSGVLIGRRRNERFLIADVINKRLSADEVRKLVLHTAQKDKVRFGSVTIRIPQDPGQAGKEQAKSYTRMLAGFNIKIKPESGSKETRAEPMAAQWQAGNFDVLTAEWNDEYISQLESFPMSEFKDMVDASTTGFSEIVFKNTGFIGAH